MAENLLNLGTYTCKGFPVCTTVQNSPLFFFLFIFLVFLLFLTCEVKIDFILFFFNWAYSTTHTCQFLSLFLEFLAWLFIKLNSIFVFFLNYILRKVTFLKRKYFLSPRAFSHVYKQIENGRLLLFFNDTRLLEWLANSFCTHVLRHIFIYSIPTEPTCGSYSNFADRTLVTICQC